MGAWGHGPFDNDDAMDWVADFGEQANWAMIEQSLRAVAEADGYVEAPESSMAIAAAEAVAVCLGKPHEAAPEVLTAFATKHSEPAGLHVELASKALGRITQPQSELCELWEETDLADAWKASLKDLNTRLKG